MVRFDFTDKEVAYGTIIWVDNDKANVDFKNPITKEHEVIPIILTALTLIGQP